MRRPGLAASGSRCPRGTTWCPKHQKCHSHSSGLGSSIAEPHSHARETAAITFIVGIALLFIDHGFWK